MKLPGTKYKQMIDGNGGFEYQKYVDENNLVIDINAGNLNPEQLLAHCEAERVTSQQSPVVAALAGRVSSTPVPSSTKLPETGYAGTRGAHFAGPPLPRSQPGSKPGSQAGSPRGGTRRRTHYKKVRKFKTRKSRM